ncbi:hypothetical protein ACFQFH_00840 [Halobaculum halobium]
MQLCFETDLPDVAATEAFTCLEALFENSPDMIDRQATDCRVSYNLTVARSASNSATASLYASTNPRSWGTYWRTSAADGASYCEKSRRRHWRPPEGRDAVAVPFQIPMDTVDAGGVGAVVVPLVAVEFPGDPIAGIVDGVKRAVALGDD